MSEPTNAVPGLDAERAGFTIALTTASARPSWDPQPAPAPGVAGTRRPDESANTAWQAADPHAGCAPAPGP